MSSFNHTLIGQFVEELYSANSLWERFYIYQKYVNRLGFYSASYTFIPSIQLDQPLPPIFLYTSEFPKGFLQQYTEQNLARHDFTLRLARDYKVAPSLNWCEPLDWREHEVSGKLLPQEAAVIEQARVDYGIINAVSIPTMMSEAGVAGMSIISHENDCLFEKLKVKSLPTLLSCSQIFHDMNYASSDLNYAFLMPFIQNLKPKEIQILRYLASGKNLKAIEDSTGISYGYASNLLNELRARLGGISRDKLMYLIGAVNLFNLN